MNKNKLKIYIVIVFVSYHRSTKWEIINVLGKSTENLLEFIFTYRIIYINLLFIVEQ